MHTIRINNEVLEYNKIIYVDVENGDDDTGDGSKENPYKNLSTGISNTTNSNNEAIRFIGEHTLNSFGDIFNNTIDVDFIGVINESKIIANSNEDRTTGDVKNKFYNIIFQISNDFSGDNRWGYYFCDDSTVDFNLYFYNCVFDLNNVLTDTSSRHRGFWVTEASSSIDYHVTNFEFINCVLVNEEGYAMITEYNGHSGENIKIINCATEGNTLNDPEDDSEIGRNTDIYTSLTSVSCDLEYNITSGEWENTGTGENPDGTQANIGVYGGLYSWGGWYLINSLLKSNNTLYTYKDNMFIQTNNHIDDSISNLSRLISLDNLIKYNMDYSLDDNGGKIFRKNINKQLLGFIESGKFNFNL